MWSIAAAVTVVLADSVTLGKPTSVMVTECVPAVRNVMSLKVWIPLSPGSVNV